MDLLTMSMASAMAKKYTDEKLDDLGLQDMTYYFCGSGEYNTSTGVPTVSSPDGNTFYFAPAVSGGLFNVYVYKNSTWTLFTSVELDLSNAPVDNTLSIVGMAADAKKTGDEIGGIKSAIDHIETLDDEIYMSWVIGGLANNGTENTNTNRIRTGFIPVSEVTTLNYTLASGYYINILRFNKSKTQLSFSGWVNNESGTITLTDLGYVRFAMKRSDDADMNTSEGANLRLFFSNILYDKIEGSMRFVGYIQTLGYTALTQCVNKGWYGCGSSHFTNITDLPSDFDTSAGGFNLVVYNPSAGNNTYMVQELSISDGSRWVRTISQSGVVGSDWKKTGSENYKFRGYLNSIGATSISSLMTNPGWYGFGGAYVSSISDLPLNYTGTAGTIEIIKPVFASSIFGISRLYDNKGNCWSKIWQNTTAVGDWVLEYGLLKDAANGWMDLYGKTVVILGDSICTNGDYSALNPTGNVPEIYIHSEDVGVELSAYATYYDIGTTVGGHEITLSDVGTEITFTPVEGDVGKVVGKPLTYNDSSLKTWWEVAAETLGFNPVAACWSGSSITSHEASNNIYKTSYAWHDAQIRKCGIRIPGTMTRTEPDLIIIHRGGNDFSHSPYGKLTANYFNNPDWHYPVTDEVSGGYGLKEGYSIVIKKLRETYPNAKIFLSTFNVLKRVDYDNFPTTNGENTLPMYSDAVREIADFFGCGVIEFDKDGITFENCYSQGYITDSSETPTHPSAKGHKVMGLKAIADLKAQYSPMS